MRIAPINVVDYSILIYIISGQPWHLCPLTSEIKLRVTLGLYADSHATHQINVHKFCFCNPQIRDDFGHTATTFFFFLSF